jgi:hypothetical protein
MDPVLQKLGGGRVVVQWRTRTMKTLIVEERRGTEADNVQWIPDFVVKVQQNARDFVKQQTCML